jgi:hypothetical protein
MLTSEEVSPRPTVSVSSPVFIASMSSTCTL